MVFNPGVVFFGALLVVALAAKSFWWLIAAAAVAGLFFAIHALTRNNRERKAAAARETEELAYRADRQHQWARRGDDRGIYGDAGAELMRSISPESAPSTSDVANEELGVAALATTPEGLTQLIAEKTTGWRWDGVRLGALSAATCGRAVSGCVIVHSAMPRRAVFARTADSRLGDS